MDRLEPHRPKVIEAIDPIDSEPIVLPRLSQAGRRVPSRAALARGAAPPFDCSAIGGYAVRHADVLATIGPVRRRVLHAGDAPGSAIGAGEAPAQAHVRIPEGTGDVPEGERVETWLLGE